MMHSFLRDTGLTKFYSTEAAACTLQEDEDLVIPQSVSTESAKALATARELLQQCLANHGCSLRQRPSWAPTRLVDVGDTQGISCPKIISTQALDVTPEWLTLSHCWGNISKQCKLLRNNIAQFTQKLPLSELSKTFLDALSITRALGFRYIWIDSLCIIQDDMADWDREALSMHKVYSLSTCTISASHASDGQGGCFSSRNPRFVYPFIMPLRLSSEGNVEYCNIHAVSLDERWKANIERGPLYQRAWVFQERLLSPRTLYFGKEQILWGCDELEACESHLQGKPKEPDAIWWGFVGDRQRFAGILRKRESEDDEPVDQSWPDLVNKYSKTKITFSKDRLLAFTGLIEALNAARSTPHSYGVWLDESIAWSMQWSRDGGTRAAQPVEFIGPTWSWLSLHTPVRCGHWMAGRGMVKPLAFMETDRQLPIPTGALRQRDALVIRAMLKIAWCKRGKEYPDSPPFFDLGYTQDREEEVAELTDSISLTAAYESKFAAESKEQITYRESVLLDTQNGCITGNVVICMPTANYEGRLSRYEGLVLEPLTKSPRLSNPITSRGYSITTDQLPTFRRVGYYSILHGVRWVATTPETEIALV
ncbi:heterokaryon incompatibility protein-domain-containing protein [Stachybotrys elegans]|uniref:Heterokaryon incompatibility protein-domain-containing protein n=1 Tax=Stachybotrys elegans TaxID=80388 RepID=A0A8K0ST80_9HYPO|nr:heterokaryon incompatibility protein-domain-containing protein [Stachybotrys elegans]